MTKEWLAPGELIGIAGLPKTPQGVNKRARDEGWEKRRRQGVQGRAVEYAFHSLPPEVRSGLHLQDLESPPYVSRTAAQQLTLWTQLFNNLNEQEQAALIDFVLREGAMAMLSRLDVDPARDENDGTPPTTA